ncbi:hypothetical protein RRG08_017148 [Elysia crispata]|uniref:Uncharacterized protein n=1 Tax=Elysia crispata TaxID=231223 RepID=A0AAE1B219_9GAST|nr:hypothetical protein RRG08_017148 [Elysia crispata]
MLVVMVYITLLHHTGDGPLWPQRSFEPDECKNNWWSNLLYINNLHNLGGQISIFHQTSITPGLSISYYWLKNRLEIFYLYSRAVNVSFSQKVISKRVLKIQNLLAGGQAGRSYKLSIEGVSSSFVDITFRFQFGHFFKVLVNLCFCLC